MSELSREEVAHIANLARLAITDQEIALYRDQLGEILTFMDNIRGIDTSDIPATIHPEPNVNHLRPDTVQPSLPLQEALAMAPAVTDGQFAVPQILGEGS